MEIDPDYFEEKGELFSEELKKADEEKTLIEQAIENNYREVIKATEINAEKCQGLSKWIAKVEGTAVEAKSKADTLDGTIKTWALIIGAASVVITVVLFLAKL